jgi:hypothetical protein
LENEEPAREEVDDMFAKLRQEYASILWKEQDELLRATQAAKAESESHEQYVKRVARDEAGVAMAVKRRALINTLRTTPVGDCEEAIALFSAKALIDLEDSMARLDPSEYSLYKAKSARSHAASVLQMWEKAARSRGELPRPSSVSEHHQRDPVAELYRLADECAGVVTQMAEEAGSADGDARPYLQEGFASMVRARVAAMRKQEIKVHERGATESEQDYLNRVARDEAGGWLAHLRALIVATLAKHGAWPEDELKLTSAGLLIELEEVEERSTSGQQQGLPRYSNPIPDESDDEFVHRIARDQAGDTAMEKRQILLAGLRNLGNLTENEIGQVSGEVLVCLEKEYDESEDALEFRREQLVRHWRPLIAYWNFLRRTENAEAQLNESEGDIPF